MHINYELFIFTFPTCYANITQSILAYIFRIS